LRKIISERKTQIIIYAFVDVLIVDTLVKKFAT